MFNIKLQAVRSSSECDRYKTSTRDFRTNAFMISYHLTCFCFRTFRRRDEKSEENHSDGHRLIAVVRHDRVRQCGVGVDADVAVLRSSEYSVTVPDVGTLESHSDHTNRAPPLEKSVYIFF